MLQKKWNLPSLIFLSLLYLQNKMKQGKTGFIPLLTAFVEEIFLKLLTTDTHFHLSDVRKSHTSGRIHDQEFITLEAIF